MPLPLIRAPETATLIGRPDLGRVSRLRLARRPLSLILLLYGLLAITYSFVNPLFEAGDEYLHFALIKSLADGAGLPVQPEDPVVYGYHQEGSQPPLFHLLAAALIRPIDTGAPGPGYLSNPHAIVGSPHALGNKNIVLAGPAPVGPSFGVVLAAHLIRLLSVAIGAGAVVAVYLLARQILPQDPSVAWFAAAWVAYLPEFLFLSASINNDMLAIVLAAFALVAINHAIRQPHALERWVIVGVLCGLAALTKLNAAGVAGIALIAIWWRLRSTPDRRWVVGAGAAVLLVPALIAGWWYVRNLLLYGEPTGLSAMYDIVHRRNLSLAGLLVELPGIRYSFWGIFGGFNVPLPAWLYWLYDGLVVAAIGGLVYGLAQRRPLAFGRVNGLALALALTWLALATLSLIRWTQSTMGSQGRLLFPAIAVLALLFAWGWSGWLSRRRQSLVFLAISGLLFVCAALAPWLAIAPAYAEPRRLPAERTAELPNPLRSTFGDDIELLGYRVGRPDGSFHQPIAGRPLAVTLYWRVTQPPKENWSVYVHLIDRQQRVLGQSNSYPGAGTYPFRRFRLGEIVEDIAYVDVDPAAPAPTLARLEVGVYRYATLTRLPAAGEQALPHDSVFLTDLAVQSGRPAAPLNQPAGQTFGGLIELIDFEVTPTAVVQPGGETRVDLRWRAINPPPADYTVFLHLVDASGRVVAQSDSEPRSGTYPTSVWPADAVIPDSEVIQAPTDLAPGRYDLKIGLYQRDSGARLPVSNWADDAVTLATLQAPSGQDSVTHIR